MKRIFPGKNKLKSTTNLFLSRYIYDTRAYKKDPKGGPVVKNLHDGEKQYYGCVDMDGCAIVPNEEKLKFLAKNTNTKGVPRVFDFVADMFIDIKTNIEYCKLNNIFDVKMPELSNLELTKTYVSPIEKYKKYLKIRLQKYNKETLPGIGKGKIMNFKDYVSFFFKSIMETPDVFPITLTGWMTSHYSSIYNTGLGVNIAKEKVATDQPKIDKFIDNPSYDYYERILINNGFSHAHHVPWNLVVDLMSPAINYYYNKYNINSIEDLFKNYYIKTKYLDIDLLKEMLFKQYNLFVNQSQPKNIYFLSNCPKVAQDGLRKTDWVTLYRQNIKYEQIQDYFSEEYWITFVLYLRNFELNRPLEPGRMDEINDNAIKLYKKLDKPSAIDYIDNRMRKFVFTRDFGELDFRKREKRWTKDLSDWQNNINKISFDLLNS